MFGKTKAVIYFSLGIVGASLIYFVDSSQAQPGKKTASHTGRVVVASAAKPARESKIIPAAHEVVEAPGSKYADPLSFLEGPANCEVVKSNIANRYAVAESTFRPRDGSLQEEFRHISRFTCSDSKFARCSFAWCSTALAEAPKSNRIPVSMRMTAAEIERELAEKLNHDQGEAQRNTRAKLADRAIAVEETLPLPKAELVNVSAPVAAPETKPAVVNLGLMAQAQAEARGEFYAGESAMNVHLAEQAQQDAVLRIAEEKLQELVNRKNSQREVIQTAAIATEHKRNVGWLRIVVPGSERMPRVRPVPSVSSSQSMGGVNGGRTIVPSTGVTAPTGTSGSLQPVASNAGIPGAMVADAGRPGTDMLTAERDRQLREAYKQALSDAARSQQAIGNGGVMQLTR